VVINGDMCGAILGCMEQFYNGIMFNVKYENKSIYDSYGKRTINPKFLKQENKN